MRVYHASNTTSGTNDDLLHSGYVSAQPWPIQFFVTRLRNGTVKRKEG